MPEPSGRASTIALAGAGLIAVGAIGIAVFRPAADSPAPPPQAAAPGADDAVAALVERVRTDPDDDAGWFELGLRHREAQRFAEAEQAFRRAGELRPGNADYAAYLGEARLLAGSAEPAAVEPLFRRALELQPGHPQARYYLATLRDLRGDHRGAIEDLIALLRDAPAGAAWEPQVRRAAETIAERSRIDLAGRLPPPRPAAPGSTATAAIPGPTREQMDAARAIPPGQQDEMVRAMVDRLAARLRSAPGDAEGWIRLMRSRMVLNEPRAAAEALRSGLAAFPNDAAAQQRLRAAAAELGVPAA